MQKTSPKILLIEPPFYRLFKDTYSLTCYPLSLGYLAGAIKKDTDWDALVYNADFFPQSESMQLRFLTGRGFDNYMKNLKGHPAKIWEEVRSCIAQYMPDVVGITAKSQNFASACLVAKLAKEFDRQIIVIVGGPHPSMVGREVFNCPDIDVCVKGEGENTIIELLQAINGREKFDGIKGIIYRLGQQIMENPPREPITDLDVLCFPHQGAPAILKDYALYPKDAFGHIFATRGCPYNCFFCGSHKVWGRNVRFRSPLNVVSEIKSLRAKGVNTISFDDDIFGISQRHIKELCGALIEHCQGLRWSCELHVNLVEAQTIALMKQAGCYLIQIGIESGNNEILRQIRKGFTIEKAFAALDIIKKYDIEVIPFFMVGFPQETEDTLKDTIASIKKSQSHCCYSIFTPYPGTEAFEFCKEQGLIKDDYDASLYNHQSPANCFCVNISRSRFRATASKIERMIDRSSKIERIKNIFSLKTLSKVRELGIARSLLKGARIFLGR